MVEPPNPPDLLELERQLLRALCQNRAARQTAREHLQGYRWRDLAHQVVFEIVTRIPQLSDEQLRAQLPARLTNAGFPDFPWAELYKPQAVSALEAEEQILRRRGASH